MSQSDNHLEFALKMRQHFDALRTALDVLKDAALITVEVCEPDMSIPGMAAEVAEVQRSNLPRIIGAGVHSSFLVPEADGKVRHQILHVHN